MMTPYDDSGSIAANQDFKIDLYDYFAKNPVEYIRVKCTENFRIWMVFVSGNVQEYKEGGTADIPLELMNYGLRGIIIRPDNDATYYVHSTTSEPVESCEERGQLDG